MTSTLVRYDVSQTLDLLRSIVAEFPDGYTYTQRRQDLNAPLVHCQYTIHGQGGCLVGMLLHRLGLVDFGEEDEPNFVDIHTLAGSNRRVADSFTPQAIDRLDVVQYAQDLHFTWAQSLNFPTMDSIWVAQKALK